MAINYAQKYSNKVDERFTQASLTENAFSKDYDWDGVSTVNIYSVATAPMKDYTMTGNNRYGTADELGDTTQSMTLTQDRSFTFTIDRRNYEDQMMVKEAGKALSRQTSEVVIPEVDMYRLIDMYRLSKLVAGAGTTSTPTPITKTNAYASFLEGVTTLLDNKAPLAGTFAFIGTEFYKNIRQDGAFIKASDIAQNMLITGQVGTVENIPLIYVPKSYLPDDVEFIITNKIAGVAPKKLSDYRIHENPPRVNGWLVEGRIYHDCFILNNKAKVIYVHKSA